MKMKKNMSPVREVSIGVLLAAALCGAGCSTGGAATVALGPEAAVTRVSEGLAQGRPQVLWEALPPSYRKDIDALVHEAAAKMDSELWDRSFDVVGKLGRVLETKREFILGHPMLAQHVERDGGTEQRWEALVGVFDLLATSELSELDKVRKLDVGAFLAGTGASLMQRLSAASALAEGGQLDEWVPGMGTTRATLVSSEGDVATVRIERNGHAPEDHTLVRVEGQWVPRQLAEEWPTRMAEARERIASYSGERMQKNKPAVLAQLSMIDGALDGLLAASTADEFNARLGTTLGVVIGAAMAQQAADPASR
jgi:hypothetical protein